MAQGDMPDDATGVKWRLEWLCPEPEPLPVAYTVSRGDASIYDVFTLLAKGQELGSSRRNLFGRRTEVELRTSRDEAWAAAHWSPFSDDITVLDCVGDVLVRLRGNWHWGWFGSGSCLVLGEQGQTLGRFEESPKGVVTVYGTSNAKTALLRQETGWLGSVRTEVEILVDIPVFGAQAADLGVTDPRKSPVNPLVDPRVLVLFASLRFGKLFLQGFLSDLILVLVLCVCCGLLARRLLCDRGDDKQLGLIREREEMLKQLTELDPESESNGSQRTIGTYASERRQRGFFDCCARGTPRKWGPDSPR